MSKRKILKKNGNYKTLFIECAKLLTRIIELIVVVVGLFLLVKGGFS